MQIGCGAGMRPLACRCGRLRAFLARRNARAVRLPAAAPPAPPPPAFARPRPSPPLSRRRSKGAHDAGRAPQRRVRTAPRAGRARRASLRRGAAPSRRRPPAAEPSRRSLPAARSPLGRGQARRGGRRRGRAPRARAADASRWRHSPGGQLSWRPGRAAVRLRQPRHHFVLLRLEQLAGYLRDKGGDAAARGEVAARRDPPQQRGRRLHPA